MTINSLSNLIKPLQSRFLCISVSSPSFEQTKKIIDNICTTYNIKITSKKKEDIINESKYGSSGIINLNELFLIIEGSILCSKEKKELSLSKIYISERNEASNILLKEIKKGNIEEIRNIIYKIYEIMKDDFSLIINDFSRKLLKKEIIYLAAHWDFEINKNYILNPIFQAEGYLYHLCDLLKV
jgi:DNA polymerase III delta prime subunit